VDEGRRSKKATEQSARLFQLSVEWFKGHAFKEEVERRAKQVPAQAAPAQGEEFWTIPSMVARYNRPEGEASRLEVLEEFRKMLTAEWLKSGLSASAPMRMGTAWQNMFQAGGPHAIFGLASNPCGHSAIRDVLKRFEAESGKAGITTVQPRTPTPDEAVAICERLILMAEEATRKNEWRLAYNILCSWGNAVLSFNSGLRGTNVARIEALDFLFSPHAMEPFGFRLDQLAKAMKMDLRRGDHAVAADKRWPILPNFQNIITCSVFVWAVMSWLGGKELEDAAMAALADDGRRFGVPQAAPADPGEGQELDDDGDPQAELLEGKAAYLLPHFSGANVPTFSKSRDGNYVSFWQQAVDSLGIEDLVMTAKTFRRMLPVLAQAMNISPHHTAIRGGWNSTGVMASFYENVEDYWRRELAAYRFQGESGPTPGATVLTLPFAPWKVHGGFHFPAPPVATLERRRFFFLNLLHLAVGVRPPNPSEGRREAGLQPLSHLEERNQRIAWLLKAIQGRREAAKSMPTVGISRALLLSGPAAAGVIAVGSAAIGAVPAAGAAAGALGAVAGGALLGTFFRISLAAASASLAVAFTLGTIFWSLGVPLVYAYSIFLLLLWSLLYCLTFGALLVFFLPTLFLCSAAWRPELACGPFETRAEASKGGRSCGLPG